jgi:methionyl-tRNA formyltransferase
LLTTLFFGTSAFAVPSLRIAAERTDVRGVVTQPDRPAGRGQKLQPAPVKTAALELGLRVYEPSTLKGFADELTGESFDCFALASYGKILPRALLDVPRLGAINVHPSMLPKYRGATPIQTAIRDGETQTGVSIMIMDAGMDTGEIVLQEAVAIAPDEDYGALHDRLAQIGARLLADAFALAESGALLRTPQHGEASVTRPIAKEDLAIDWSWNATRVVNHVRAYAPRPAARATIAGETVKVLRAHVAPGGDVVIDELIAPNRGRESGAAFRARHGERAS